MKDTPQHENTCINPILQLHLHSFQSVYHFTPVRTDVGSRHSSVSIVSTQRNGQGQVFFTSPPRPKPALRPTQPPVQWDVKLITHLQLVSPTSNGVVFN